MLTGKNALITGIANKNSIAWAIAQALHEQGAAVGLSYAHDKLARRVNPLVATLDCDFAQKCDVQSDDEIAQLMTDFGARFGRLDILVHAIAYAERDDINGRFSETGRDGFAAAMDVSVYSLIALARAAQPWMKNGGSIITLSYYGAQKVFPKYNVMGVAKAALEASVRYLAADLGAQQIRVNALSPGPIKTLSAGAFGGFNQMLEHVAEVSPLQRNVTQADVGNAAVFLASDLAATITGEVMQVDSGYHTLGMTMPSHSA